MAHATLEDVTERFAPLFGAIGADAREREATRSLPYDHVATLAAAGFGALRVPAEYGGTGLSFRELADVLHELARADSNLPQIFRSHFIFTELLIEAPPSAEREQWLRRVASGTLFGGAHTERSQVNASRFSTRITTTADGRRVLDGEKYYSTGSLFADWIITLAEDDQGPVTIAVPREAQGLELVDDWDGFGQRLTASGTTRFHSVDLAQTMPVPVDASASGLATTIAQYFHIAALSGIAGSLHHDLLEYVRQRNRYFSQGTRRQPRHDVQVQEVVGEVSSAVHGVRLAQRAAADAIDAALRSSSSESADEAEVGIYRAQVLTQTLTLHAASRAFDVGGSTPLSASYGWDRYWRNARTLANHNPISYRLSAIGDHELNGTSPFRAWYSGTDLRSRPEEDAARRAPSADTVEGAAAWSS